ncbi:MULTISPECIES: Druantia anti-phage system protein DruA [unclassified Rathayibacter]|uniref:Druantia anti-phage system protein DruA n=1 Tax=unclassified Rathayibacter TaxID=2609250 RepID=UPI001C6300AC|nr:MULTISPECIES: Druantia anti-phage system protein DruA [unclassified Rathayibacter]
MTDEDETKFVNISLPTGTSRTEREGFLRLCKALSTAHLDPRRPVVRERLFVEAKITNLYNRPTLGAAAHTLIDLVEQGWTLKLHQHGPLLMPPLPHPDPETEKARIRRQEHLRRDPQLRQSSVRRFIERMEKPSEHAGGLVSIFNLMRDGRELADALETADDPSAVIQPYVQIVDSGECDYTGLALHDVWRYFRHTWSNAYFTVPGRSMPILVRDAATPHHAVIGLAAVSSPVVQIAERDQWMGWDTDAFLEATRERPTQKVAQWLSSRIETQLREIYVEDLLNDDVLQPTALQQPTPEAVALLRADAERHRQKHHRTPMREVRQIGRDDWTERALTPLFRSKRATVLADTLESALALHPYLKPTPTAAGLAAALKDTKARTQVRRLVRRARGERVGTVIADLTVCGAVAPYNALAAGKLVGALAVSPKVISAYRAKYSRPSEIASAVAGRGLERESRLCFISTTSLYGSGSSQYNRLRWPAEVMGGPSGEQISFHQLGRSRSFGTSQFTDETVDALVRLSRLQGATVRVNSLFGEGVSPRLRKVRLGLAALGWSSNALLKHGRERILYGVRLVENLRDYSLGIDTEPRYLVDPEQVDAPAAVAQWWFERWGHRRAGQAAVAESMRAHRLVRPLRHGARVSLPDIEDAPSEYTPPATTQ